MDLGQIDLAIEDGTFFDNDALIAFADRLKASGGTAHIMGLVSDGGVHGHLNHIKAAITAITDCDLLSLDASDFHYLMSQNPELRHRVAGVLRRGERTDYGQAGEAPWLEEDKGLSG